MRYRRATATETAFFQVRLPRIGVAMLLGASLSGSGVTFQGVFRNPLVSSFIFVVSAGAGLAILPGGGSLAIQLSAFGFGTLAVLTAVRWTGSMPATRRWFWCCRATSWAAFFPRCYPCSNTRPIRKAGFQ